MPGAVLRAGPHHSAFPEILVGPALLRATYVRGKGRNRRSQIPLGISGLEWVGCIRPSPTNLRKRVPGSEKSPELEMVWLGRSGKAPPGRMGLWSRIPRVCLPSPSSEDQLMWDQPLLGLNRAGVISEMLDRARKPPKPPALAALAPVCHLRPYFCGQMLFTCGFPTPAEGSRAFAQDC